MTIEREIYTNQIKELIDQNCIKILAGIKRAGKTKILKNTIEELKKRQTKKENITEINFENGTFHKNKNNTQLYKILEKTNFFFIIRSWFLMFVMTSLQKEDYRKWLIKLPPYTKSIL